MLQADLIHKRIGFVMLTRKFKLLIYNFARITAAFCFGFETGDAMSMMKGVYHCLATIIQPVQGFI